MTVQSGPTFQYAAVTHKGLVRQLNEDAILVTNAILMGDSASRCGTVSVQGRPVFADMASMLLRSMSRGRGCLMSQAKARDIASLQWTARMGN